MPFADEEIRLTVPATVNKADGSTSLVMLDLVGVVLNERTGIWCNQCLLPSVVEVDINYLVAGTLQTFARWTYAECLDCSEHESRPRT
jgi:hypothetical protein